MKILCKKYLYETKTNLFHGAHPSVSNADALEVDPDVFFTGRLRVNGTPVVEKTIPTCVLLGTTFLTLIGDRVGLMDPLGQDGSIFASVRLSENIKITENQR